MRSSSLAATCLSAAVVVVSCGGTDPEPPAEARWTIELDDIDAALLSVAPVGDALHAVGGPLVGDGPPSILRQDGAAWTETTPPAGWNGAAWWLWSGAADQMWVVGAQAQVARGAPGALQMLPTPPIASATTATLYGVWGSGPDDVWMVGGFRSGSEALLLRWDGDSIRRVELTGTASIAATQTLFKVWGSGPNDVMIVGTGGTAVHYDGTRFRLTPTRVSTRLLTVHGRGPNEMYAVGGAASGVVLQYDGFSWRDISDEFAPPLNGVFAAPDGALWACGPNGYVARWDGKSWTIIETDVAARDFHGIVATDAVYTVGGRLANEAGSRRGLIGRFGL